jgi:hypothetical protein
MFPSSGAETVPMNVAQCVHVLGQPPVSFPISELDCDPATS